ncbi:MAG: hypothetical protein LBL71_02570 [Endomicrobium sp.]|nr:hypothetical protein [Endomicrobium sp.]
MKKLALVMSLVIMLGVPMSAHSAKDGFWWGSGRCASYFIKTLVEGISYIKLQNLLKAHIPLLEANGTPASIVGHILTGVAIAGTDALIKNFAYDKMFGEVKEEIDPKAKKDCKKKK